MHQFGEHLGMAFQIKDDLFDYGEEKIGKPLGIDIKERKMTLPLIYAINNSTFSERRKIKNIFKNFNKDRIKVNELIQLVKDKGGLDFAKARMEDYQKKALKLLFEFPKSEYRDALERMVGFVIERKI